VTVWLYIMLCALMSPAPDERTDLGLRFPERVLINFIRVSCESGSEPWARGVAARVSAQIVRNTFLIGMRARIVGLSNEIKHTN